TLIRHAVARAGFFTALSFVTLGAQARNPLAVASGGSAPGRPLAIEDYYRLKTVGSPELSPDGKWVAYTVTTRVEATNGNTSEVWLAAFDGSTPPQQAGTPGEDATAPAWLADGHLRYTVSGRTMSVDPAAPTSPAEIAAGAAPAGGRGGGRGGRGGRSMLPSPDGRWVAAVRDMPVPKREKVYESDFAKRHEERFKGVEFDYIDFQRDGAPFPLPNRVDPSVNPPQEIFLTPAGGSDRQLTHLGLRPAGANWNRAGTMLAFTADSGYRNELLYGRSDVWTVTTDGVVKKLTSSSDHSYSGAEFSPDGAWILTTRSTPTDAVIAKHMNNGGPVDIVVIPANGGREINLTTVWDYLPSGAFWSNDGKFIYFTGGVGGTTHLFRVSPSGGAVQQVTLGQRRLSGLSFDRAQSKMAYQVGAFEAPSEIWVANFDGGGERQLTHVHDSFTREIALSKSERLIFKSADGAAVEGWLMYPYGYQAGARTTYPLIVSNHGGPHAANEYGFDFKNQYFAANGYFVLEVNFRSSTGYGERFLWGTWGAWGTKDGQDVMAGIDYSLAHYPIDRAKVALIGHSYGGFMTNWLITQYPDRFAAAASGAGIANWTSDFANSDIPRTKETEFWGPPSDPKARETMIRQSPITYANRVRTPTLFINGEVDHRVPFSENEQLYVAIKKQGVPAKMIQYAGQPHSISGSWNNVHRMLNERGWFDKYVKGIGMTQAGATPMPRR
ncbi:MAG: S9 family peptidase, partial [Gemmatimonadaceae bacterium]